MTSKKGKVSCITETASRQEVVKLLKQATLMVKRNTAPQLLSMLARKGHGDEE